LATTDKELLRAIGEIKHDDLKLSTYTTDDVPSTAAIARQIFITVSGTVAGGLLLKLLTKYFANKPTARTTINGIDMTNNSSQVFITINTYIQQQKIDEDKGEKDKGKCEVITSD